MFTSDTDRSYRTAKIYLIASVLVGAFGAVYEHFSFGVYSPYMMFAFAIPLLGGALPFYLVEAKKLRTGKGGLFSRLAGDPGYAEMYHAGIATLTMGSIMKGVLDIYGTTNRLLIVYLMAGIILMIAAVTGPSLQNSEYHRRGDAYEDTGGNTAE